MATDRYHVCSTCSNRRWVPRLFDALRELASGTLPACEACGQTTHIELEFSFGLDAGRHPCKAVAAFLPKSIAAWEQGADQSRVEFFPFLVIVESLEEDYHSVWLPYWHIVTHSSAHIETKYGQWAPFIAADSYRLMVKQAREAGFDI